MITPVTFAPAVWMILDQLHKVPAYLCAACMWLGGTGKENECIHFINDSGLFRCFSNTSMPTDNTDELAFN